MVNIKKPGLIPSKLGGDGIRRHRASWLALLTIFLGLVYVGGSWSPSHYGVALQIIGTPQLGPTPGEAWLIRSDEWAVLTGHDHRFGHHLVGNAHPTNSSY